MHVRSFVLGSLFMLGLVVTAVIVAAVIVLDNVEIVVPVDVDEYSMMVGDELASAALFTVPQTLDEIKMQVPGMVSEKMSGMFDRASLDIGGWRVQIPPETLRELDEGVQSMVTECIHKLLEDIEPEHIAEQLRAEGEIRMREMLPDLMSQTVIIDVWGVFSIPVRVRTE